MQVLSKKQRCIFFRGVVHCLEFVPLKYIRAEGFPKSLCERFLLSTPLSFVLLGFTQFHRNSKGEKDTDQCYVGVLRTDQLFSVESYG